MNLQKKFLMKKSIIKFTYNRNGKPMRNNINHVESVEESILNVIESGKSTLYIRLDTYGYIYMLFRIDTSRMEEGIISLHKIKKIVAIRTGEN